jgi:hypothetical protein
MVVAPSTRDQQALVRVEAIIHSAGWGQPRRLLWLTADRAECHEIPLSPAWAAENPRLLLDALTDTVHRRPSLIAGHDAWILAEEQRVADSRRRVVLLAAADGTALRLTRRQMPGAAPLVTSINPARMFDGPLPALSNLAALSRMQ